MKKNVPVAVVVIVLVVVVALVLFLGYKKTATPAAEETNPFTGEPGIPGSAMGGAPGMSPDMPSGVQPPGGGGGTGGGAGGAAGEEALGGM